MAKERFTAPRVDAFKCPPDKDQAFLWDTDAMGLGLRVTPKGEPAYIFQSQLNGRSIRITIGSPSAWRLENHKERAPDGAMVEIQGARARARELQRLIDQGLDPREVARQKSDAQTKAIQARVDAAEAAKVAAATVGEVWQIYIEARREHWGELHYRDHVNKAQAGGLPSGKRGAGKQLTKPGPLAALMPLALKDLNQETIEAWAAKEGKSRPASARLAWRLLKVFLSWCASNKKYSALVPAANPAKNTTTREALGKAAVKDDVLQRGQLDAWFKAVQQIPNPTTAACLQVLLLTGARLNEVLKIRWDKVNFQWKTLKINDKVDGEREIPLTPYVESLIAALPRRNEFVFSSARCLRMDNANIARRERKGVAKGKTPPTGDLLETSATGHISEPNTPHTRACKAAGIEGLTLHGLRRSFSTLCEWLEIPAGVVAQIQGHKPSATAERHYKFRPVELLAVHHNRIERWILEQAGIDFQAKAQPAPLRAVG